MISVQLAPQALRSDGHVIAPEGVGLAVNGTGVVVTGSGVADGPDVRITGPVTGAVVMKGSGVAAGVTFGAAEGKRAMVPVALSRTSAAIITIMTIPAMAGIFPFPGEPAGDASGALTRCVPP